MPRGGFDDYESGGRSRVDNDKYGSSRHRRGSDDDSRDRGKGMEVARRGKSKKYSDSEDEEPKKKSKSKSKKKTKSKKRDASSDEDDDDEVIVTKTAKYKDVDIHDIMGEYLDALIKVFEVRTEKIEKWCHEGLIRLDNKTGMFDADKLIKQKASDDEKKEWARFEKRYKRNMEENKEMQQASGGYRGYAGPSRPMTLYDPRCIRCAVHGRYCGHLVY